MTFTQRQKVTPLQKWGASFNSQLRRNVQNISFSLPSTQDIPNSQGVFVFL